MYFEVKLPADALLKISNTLNITDEVLRYLLVTFDEKGRRAIEEAKVRSASRSDKEGRGYGQKHQPSNFDGTFNT